MPHHHLTHLLPLSIAYAVCCQLKGQVLKLQAPSGRQSLGSSAIRMLACRRKGLPLLAHQTFQVHMRQSLFDLGLMRLQLLRQATRHKQNHPLFVGDQGMHAGCVQSRT